MARPDLPPQYLKAGGEYRAALKKLGLQPYFLGWGWETARKRWILVLVTPLVDAGGHLELNKLLFAAYNADVTPREISPFIVRVYSPKIVPEGFYMLMDRELYVDTGRGRKGGIKVEKMEETFLGVEHETKNTYETPANRDVRYHDRLAGWRRFKSNVDKLAA